MPVRTEILPSFYKDSVVLMRIASQVRTRPGVREMAAFMGTPSNHGLLEQIGLATAESNGARPNDLILTVDATSDAAAEGALAAATDLLAQRRQASESAVGVRPRTLESALRMLPGANLVAVSVPGAYAKFEAMKAIKQGLHVFLFSDNVPLQDEIELKSEALKRGLLCMGPDCGTAYLNGIGLGFTKVVPRGRIGCVAAAGTGLQAVVSRIVGYKSHGTVSSAVLLAKAADTMPEVREAKTINEALSLVKRKLKEEARSELIRRSELKLEKTDFDPRKFYEEKVMLGTALKL